MNGDSYLRFFRGGLDTLQIAEKFCVQESEVFNEMHRARSRENALRRGREAWHRYWADLNPDKKALYYWRKKMRQAGLSVAEIRRALTAINNETRSASPCARRAGDSAPRAAFSSDTALPPP